jgi:hypothetical protein
MRAKTMLWEAFTISVCLTSSPAGAACPDGHVSVDRELREAAYVIVAKATSVKPNAVRRLRYPGGSYRATGRLQTVKVEEIFKGRAPRIITFFDERSSAQFPVKVGSRYLIFFHRRKGEVEPYIDTCGNSASLDSVGRAKLIWLRQHSNPSGH